MFRKNILYLTVSLALGLWLGFFVANMIGRARRDNERTPGAQSSQAEGADGASSAQPSPAITDEQIRDAIAKTDARADDIKLQKNFGRLLYQYANRTQNPAYLPDIVRFLKRAYDADPADRDLTVELANALFDLGQTSGEAENFGKAREYYMKALKQKPDDASVLTDLGQTYYYGKPSDPQKAISIYRQALTVAPRDERALQSLATALISTGKHEEAQQKIEELRKLNPNNPALSNLRAQLAQSRNAASSSPQE